MNTETKTMPAQEVAPEKPTKGWGEWISDTVSSVTGSKDTVESLETERKKYNDEIDARLNKLPPADASADSKGTVKPSADDMGGGRRRRRTKRIRRSKKTKRRRGKRSGKRTRR